MSDNMSRSGKLISQDYIARMKFYLSTVSTMPLSSNGSVNITLLASQAGVPAQSIYKNPTIKKLVEDERLRLGVMSRTELREAKPGPDDDDTQTIRNVTEVRESREVRALERQHHKLEQQNAALVAENAELRRQNKYFRLQADRADLMIETGRRVPVPPKRLP